METKKEGLTGRPPLPGGVMSDVKPASGKQGQRIDTLKIDPARVKRIAKAVSRHVHAFKGDTYTVITNMRSGTPANVIPEMASRLGMSQDGFFTVLGLPKSTMKSRISKNDVLSGSEQDRVYRAHRVWSRAVEVLEDDDSARKWINRENRSLGGEVPLALLDTEVGYELVLDTLARIEYGVVS